MRRTARAGVTGLVIVNALTMVIEGIALFGIGVLLLLSGQIFWLVVWLLFGTLVMGLLFAVIRLPIIGLAVLLGMVGGAEAEDQASPRLDS